ncbi:MAG: metal-dependent hydrolase [bacterium]|nr:metal-dependent hydrolase [bacterium]
MDPLTHVTLGACIAMAISPAPRRRAAGFAGAIAGLLPDADVLLRSNSDPLMFLEFHRHFTHAWVVQPIVALVAWFLAAGWHRARGKDPALRAPYWPLILAAASHPFCDLWTSYGTHVLWPFSLERSTLDWVSVVDPLLTLPLIGTCFAAWKWSPQRWLCASAILWVSLYLGLALHQRGRAVEALHDHLQVNQVKPERISVRPTLGNIVVWRAIWLHQDQVACAGVRVGKQVTLKEGDRAELLDPADTTTWQALAPAGSVLLGDVKRFAHFSNGWLIWHPDHEGVIGDARYSMAPGKLQPIWGIRIGDKAPSEHATYETYREGSRERLGGLWSSILGSPSE